MKLRGMIKTSGFIVTANSPGRLARPGGGAYFPSRKAKIRRARKRGGEAILGAKNCRK